MYVWQIPLLENPTSKRNEFDASFIALCFTSSSRSWRWIMVPIAPSMTIIRFSSSFSSCNPRPEQKATFIFESLLSYQLYINLRDVAFFFGCSESPWPIFQGFQLKNWLKSLHLELGFVLSSFLLFTSRRSLREWERFICSASGYSLSCTNLFGSSAKKRTRMRRELSRPAYPVFTVWGCQTLTCVHTLNMFEWAQLFKKVYSVRFKKWLDFVVAVFCHSFSKRKESRNMKWMCTYMYVQLSVSDSYIC